MNAFGWTPQAPLILAVVRLAWLLSLCLSAAAARTCTRLLVVRGAMEVIFPYLSALALAAMGIARLISDAPAGLSTLEDSGFWASSVSGVVCAALETYYTIEAFPLVRSLARRRAEARERQLTGERRLDRELLGVEAGAADGERPPAPSDGSSGLALASTSGVSDGVSSTGGSGSTGLTESREEKDKREKEEKTRKEKEQRKPTVKKLIQLATVDWHLLVLAGCLLVMAAVSEVLIPHFVGETISDIIKAEEKGTLESRPFKWPALKLLVSAFFCGAFSSCRGATFIWIGSRVSVRLRQSLFDSLAHQEIGFFDTTKTGELTSRMTQDCQKVSDQVTLNVNVFLRTLVQTVTTLAFMMSLAPALTSVAFVSVPAIVFISKKYGAVMRDLSEKTQKSLADANAVAEESLSSMATVRMFAAERLESARFGDKLEVFGMLTRRQARFYILYLSATMFLPNSVTALVLFYGGKLAMEGQMKAGSLLSFVFYLQTLNSNFSTLGDFYTNMVQAIGAATRVFELRGREPELQLHPSPEAARGAPRHPEGALRLEGVRFNYPARPDVEVLKDFNLDIPAGQVVALVGPSGNGKSTVVGLLKRLYKAKEGRVLLDGVSVWDFPHEEYHRVVSIVGQEPVLHARTIKENILYGLVNPSHASDASSSSASGSGQQVHVDDAQVHEAARKANAHEFIMNMPEGYDTQVGERGVQLSGGQKQRIAIARSLVRRPKVLLLDEATSALDAESERQVQQAIDKMITDGSMTVIIIAHRLSTVRNSHKICVVSGGQIVEEGPMDELVAKRGHYFRLVECQLAGCSTLPATTTDKGSSSGESAEEQKEQVK